MQMRSRCRYRDGTSKRLPSMLRVPSLLRCVRYSCAVKDARSCSLDGLSRPPEFAGVLVWEGNGREWTAVCEGRFGELQQAAEAVGGRVVDRGTPSLDEIFVARAGGNQS